MKSKQEILSDADMQDKNSQILADDHAKRQVKRDYQSIIEVYTKGEICNCCRNQSMYWFTLTGFCMMCQQSYALIDKPVKEESKVTKKTAAWYN